MERAKTAKNQDKNHNFRNGLLVGLGFGCVGGGIGGYFVARKKLLKKVKEDIRRAKKRGFEEGFDKAIEKTEKFIDENVIVVENNDPEEIQKAFEEIIAKTAKKSVEVTVSDDPKAMNDDYDKAIDEKIADVDDWDLTIDDEEAMKRSEERSKYLDLVERYQKRPEDGPMHISRKQFEEENYLDKVYVTYYAGDNTFAEDNNSDNKMDAFENFGVVDGNDLFMKRIVDDDGDDDPDMTYIRNFSTNCVYEISRTKATYASLKSGEIFLNE